MSGMQQRRMRAEDMSKWEVGYEGALLFMHDRAYFNESLQLQRKEKFQTSKHLKFSWEKNSHFPKISFELFLYFRRPFFSHFLHFLCVSPLATAAGTTAQPTFLHHSFSKFHLFPPFFSTLFHCFSSKFTTTTAQFWFYNCKLHFTTAQIVMSCTLKYALMHASM